MRSDSEGCGLKGVGGGDRVLCSRFLDIAYPYCIDLGLRVSSAGVRFIVNVPIIVFAGSVVAEPSCGGAVAAFCGPFFLFRWFLFVTASFSSFILTFTVFPFPTGAGEFLLVCVACVRDACIVWAISIKGGGDADVLLDRRTRYVSG